MAASYNFRTAFNGFNREDVVHYIEYINSKNTTLVNQLRADLANAQQEVATLRETPPKDFDMEEIEQLKARIAQLEDEVLTAQIAKSDAEAGLEAMTKQRDEAIAAQSAVKNNSEAELETYRRAERMEREAKERADAMYAQANAVIANASAKVDEAAQHINGIADQVAEQLSVLQNAILDSKSALKDASASISNIRA